MGIFFSLYDEPRKLFQEIEAVDPNQQQNPDTSTTDYTQEPDDNQQQQNADPNANPANAPEDYTIPDGGEDQTPEEADNNPPENGTKAAPAPADNGAPPVEGGPAPGETGGTEDYTTDGGRDEGGAPPAEGGNGGDAPPSGGEEDGEGDNYGEDPSSASSSEDEIKSLEDEIFSNYTNAQRNIMTRELKRNFNDLFIILSDLIERINDIPKIKEHIRTIEFVSNKVSELRDMIADYLYYTFDTESYVKNQIVYRRYTYLINQIADMIAKIPLIKPSDAHDSAD